MGDNIDKEFSSSHIFYDTSLNNIAVANLSVTSTQTIEFTKEELDDLDNSYVDDTGWNRFTVNQWRL